MDDARIFPDDYVPNAQGAAYHAKWAKSNPGEASKWGAYRDKVIAHKKGNARPSAPALATKYGKALVAAGRMHVSVIDLGAVWTPPPPPDGEPIPSNGQITEGGTYTGNYNGGTIVIDTEDLVTIVSATITNESGSDIFRGLGGLFQIKRLVLDHCTINGANARVFDQEFGDTIVVRNCTINKTAGMKFGPQNSGCTILVTKTRITNIQGSVLGGPDLTQFTQFNQVQEAASIEVSWNEIINDSTEGSFAEDLISLFKTIGAHVHDNYFYGQWTPGNPTSSSQGGITVEEEGAANNIIENNQVVAGMGIALNFNIGANNIVRNNRIVRSGYYPDGVTRANIGFAGLVSFPGSPGRGPQNGNHAHGNVVGYMSGMIHGGGRVDYLDGDLPPDCLPLNSHLSPFPGTITLAHEQAELVLWNQKKATNGIVVGA